MRAGPPAESVEIPRAIARIAAGRPVRAVWENELAGFTFEVGSGNGRCFAKWAPEASGIDLRAEADRLSWASAFTPVPRVLDEGADEDGSWMLTTALSGENAVTERWTAAPGDAVTAIGEGLRALHEALPVDPCPFSWSLADRVADVQRRAATGELHPERWHPAHRSLDIEQALAVLAEAPATDRLVVCHGDACAPNTMISERGHWSGHVDLGALGVGDRWADLAVATWSTEWNYGPGWETHLLTAYGIEPDPERTRYYRLLWDLGP